jgi:hypothetical protein
MVLGMALLLLLGVSSHSRSGTGRIDIVLKIETATNAFSGTGRSADRSRATLNKYLGRHASESWHPGLEKASAVRPILSASLPALKPLRARQLRVFGGYFGI